MHLQRNGSDIQMFSFVSNNSLDSVKALANKLGDLDYRITGLCAVNLYGYGISTNCFDVAVKSDEAVYSAVKKLGLGTPWHGSYDPFTDYDERGWWIRIQGDILGKPVMHPAGIKLHNKSLLLDRLEIYFNYDQSIAKAIGYVALTLDDEKIKKYRKYWQLL